MKGRADRGCGYSPPYISRTTLCPRKAPILPAKTKRATRRAAQAGIVVRDDAVVRFIKQRNRCALNTPQRLQPTLSFVGALNDLQTAVLRRFGAGDQRPYSMGPKQACTRNWKRAYLYVRGTGYTDYRPFHTYKIERLPHGTGYQVPCTFHAEISR